MLKQQKPVVLCIGGHDPSGGAGIQADIETLLSLGCHPCTVLTCLTQQDSATVHRIHACSAEQIKAHIDCLFDDFDIAAIKIGLLVSVEQVEVIRSLLNAHPHIPVVLDPVLSSGDGTHLTAKGLTHDLTKNLLPLCTLITPNLNEARALCNRTDGEPNVIANLLITKSPAVFLSGGDLDGDVVTNLFQTKNQNPTTWTWPKCEGQFHGTGCTLASAIAGYLAHGQSLLSAVEQAQRYTDQCVRKAQAIAKGQQLLDRRL